ncbi:hypothetical protein PGT21_004043 [Puccinia graminis f. sp. tritici]|uniref:Uncharacterized protein n=1 Tax=Puccinia graminis f. sp. tritici TaxID=56615 RepID=A0A5B0PVY1_PUCGR|nr:hypothetical protein PGTUg99_004289 [Puccinia graminis f. sp. tritici]KAA1117335.1 hypothetical protein PGT21_004043 [Puccinia graminis f. sp. tritici]
MGEFFNTQAGPPSPSGPSKPPRWMGRRPQRTTAAALDFFTRIPQGRPPPTTLNPYPRPSLSTGPWTTTINSTLDLLLAIDYRQISSKYSDRSTRRN